MAAPLKADTDFASQPAEVWGNEIVTEPVTRSWAEDVPVPAPVTGSAAQPVSYSTSDDWATQVVFVHSNFRWLEAGGSIPASVMRVKTLLPPASNQCINAC